MSGLGLKSRLECPRCRYSNFKDNRCSYCGELTKILVWFGNREEVARESNQIRKKSFKV